MPVGYVLTLVILGVCTVAALPRPRRMSRARYALTVAIDEVPHWAAVGLVLATWLAWSEGDLEGPAGAGLGVCAGLLLVGLAELTRRGLRAATVVDSVARAHDVEPTRGGWLRRWRPMLFPVPWRPRSVVREGPVAYGEHPRQRLDVYRPRRARAPGPVLVYFHGGGYSSGSNRREGRALLHHLAARGWVCISAAYRLRPGADFTDHLQDARTALRWAHDYAADHGGDPSSLVMAGSSAGAHLTSLCALTQVDGDPERPRVDAAVCLYGYYGRYYGRGEDESPASTPLALATSHAPPFFMAHGDHDSYAPVEDARALHRRLEAGSPGETWYAELPGGQHGFDALLAWRCGAVIEGIDAFLGRVLGGSAAGPPETAREGSREGRKQRRLTRAPAHRHHVRPGRRPRRGRGRSSRRGARPPPRGAP